MRQENDVKNNWSIKLKEEELDIYKKWIKTGEVSSHTETFIEEKTITIPLIHKEIVITRAATNDSDQCDEDTKTIKIPLSKEEIEIKKHEVMLSDVEIYTNKYEELKHVQEIIKKEKLNIEAIGDNTIVNDVKYND